MPDEPERDPETTPEAALGVAAVARRLGVATGTLRTWDRRYGLGPSGHVAGSRRRYTARDLARLAVMRRLMLDGVGAAEAAAVALATEPDLEAGAGLAAEDPSAHGRPAPHRRARAGGGRVVPLRDASPAARGLARAAMSLDSDACVELIASALRRRGVVATWNDLLLPVLAGVGERWRATGAGVEVEHLLSECAEIALRIGVRPGPTAPGRRPVLLAGVEPEDHRLPLVALSAAMTERQVPARLLGARLPVRALVDAVSRTGPVAVFLWSQGARGPVVPPEPHLFAGVRPRPVVLVGGPGYADARWRTDLRWQPGVPEAVDALAALASVGAGSGGSPGAGPSAR